MRKSWPILAGWALFGVFAAHADLTLLLEEPYGAFGGMTPTGHAAVYLSRVCADTPVTLRRCVPGEQGVVISRYHRVGGYDWLAIPLIPYLYAVERADQAPTFATSQQVDELRDTYRRTHLEEVAPDNPDGSTPHGDWIQLVGESYNRTIYTFGVTTTEAQDDALIRAFNAGPNRSRFSLLFQNCADFSREVIDRYFPKAIHRSFTADIGIMTPRDAAQCMIGYGKKHPELEFSSYLIPQVPGTLPRSTRVRGVLEEFVKQKRYALPLAPLAVLHPGIGIGMAYAWVRGARFAPQKIAASHGGTLQPELVASALDSDDRIPSGHPTGIATITSRQ